MTGGLRGFSTVAGALKMKKLICNPEQKQAQNCREHILLYMDERHTLDCSIMDEKKTLD